MVRELAPELPTKHFLHTNFVPSDAQCNAIRAHLDESFKSLDQLDAEMTRLQTALAELAERREKLCADISAHEALVSPARRVPQDVIQEIFVACLPTDRNAVLVSTEAPILLSHICSAWRHIALSTPRLWSSLHIVVPNTSRKVQQLCEVIKLWLGRSGGLPLSITVVLSRTFDESISAADIFTTLRMFAPRWSNIQFPLALETESLQESLAQIRTEDVPMLKNILLCSWIKDPFQANYLPILEAPTLRSASINFFGHTSVLPAQWDSLVELHLNTGNRSGRSLGFAITGGGLARRATTYLSPRSAMDILRKCPNLVYTSLEVTYDIAEANTQITVDDAFGPPVVLSKLESFSISFPGVRPSDAFFETLILPELRSFDFTGCIGKSRAPFYSIIERTSSLKELALQLRRFRIEPILECLKISSDLTKLKLQSLESMQWRSWFSTNHDPPAANPHQELLTLLTASNTGAVCPRLTSIELDRCTLFSDTGLGDFLVKRLGREDGTEPLKNFRATFNREKEIDLEERLEPFIPADVTVSLSYPSRQSLIEPALYSPWEGVFGSIPSIRKICGRRGGSSGRREADYFVTCKCKYCEANSTIKSGPSNAWQALYSRRTARKF